MDAEMWRDAGVGSQEMYRAAQALESWFGWQEYRQPPAARAAIRECQDLHFQLVEIEREWEHQAELARLALLSELSDDPTAEELEAFAADEERFAALVAWWRADVACAPTGAPNAETLRALALHYGYAEWAEALTHPGDLL